MEESKETQSELFTIGGREWRVKISAGTMRLAEIYGLEVDRETLGAMSTSSVACRLLTAALMAEEEDVTEEEVAAWLHQGNHDDALAFVLDRYTALQQRWLAWTQARTDRQMRGLVAALKGAGIDGDAFEAIAAEEIPEEKADEEAD